MNTNIDNREIRVFISSTFQDMQAERDYLILKVFPRLQEEAVKRDVSIIPLDLRWGVTDKEAQSGKVLQICLEEIENSRPFFIGLLGNRYGWCPTKDELAKNDILRERWGNWLEQDFEKGLSVTEIEMQYGVLRAEYDLNAFFFIKKGEDPDSENLEKLKKLKQSIRENKRYPVSDYVTPEDLGQQVENTFIGLLNEIFPVTSLSETDKERIAQIAFIKSRTEVYVPNESYMKTLDEFLKNSVQRNLVVVGENGIGKSALLANWSATHKDDKDWVLLFYPIGNRKKDCECLDLLKNLYQEICYILHSKDESNFEGKDNVEEIISHIASLSKEHKILIVWDGINQIVDENNAKSLHWLPDNFPGNIKNIYSTTPVDKTLEVFQKRHYPQLRLSLLKEDERGEITRRYLWHLRKKLTEEQTFRIVHGANNGSAIVLRTMINELVNFGKHEEIDEYIDYYLKATTTEDFFYLVIKRFESSYGEELVRMSLASLAFSYYGLSEAELMELLQVRPLDWSCFYCALKPHVIVRNGLLTFSHQVFRDAVICLYNDLREVTLQMLSDYFGSKIKDRKDSHLAENYITASPFTGNLELIDEDTKFGLLFYEGENIPAVVNLSNNTVVPNRTCEELPYLYEALGEYGKLYKLLLDFGAFLYLERKNERALAHLWHTLERVNDRKYSLSNFLSLPFNPNREYAMYYIHLAQFIAEYFSHEELVSSLFVRALEIEDMEQKKQQHEIAISVDIYSHIAQYYLGSRQFDKARMLFTKALQISIRNNGVQSTQTAMCYNYLGVIAHEKNNLKVALEFHKKALRCFLAALNHGELSILADIYSNLALLNDKIHNYKTAIEYHKKALDIRLKGGLNSNIDLAMAYNGLAYTYDSIKEYGKAIKYYNSAIEILVEYYESEKSEFAVVYENLGVTYCNLKQWPLAHVNVQKAFKIYTRVYGREHPQTIACQHLLHDIVKELA